MKKKIEDKVLELRKNSPMLLVLCFLGFWTLSGFDIFAYAHLAGLQTIDLALTTCVSTTILIIITLFIIGELHDSIMTIRPGSVFVKDKKIIRRFTEKFLCWKWEYEKLLDGVELLTVNPRYVKIDMHLRPITENPKVRDLFYNIVIEIDKTPEQHLALMEFLSKWRVRGVRYVQDVLQFICYELNEEMSKELAKYYNPCDVEQQQKFKNIVVDFIRKRLEYQLPFTIKSVSFSL